MWRILLITATLCASPETTFGGRMRHRPMENGDDERSDWDVQSSSNLDRHDRHRNDREYKSDRETLYTFRSPWEFEQDQDRYRSSGSSRFENFRHKNGDRMDMDRMDDEKMDRDDRHGDPSRHHRHHTRNEDHHGHHHRHGHMPPPMSSSSSDLDEERHKINYSNQDRGRPYMNHMTHMSHNHDHNDRDKRQPPRRYGYRHGEESMESKEMKNWSDRHAQAARFDPRRDDDMDTDMDIKMNRDIMGRNRDRVMTMDRDRSSHRDHHDRDVEWREDPHMKSRPGSFKYVPTSGVHAANHNNRPSDFERGWTNRNRPTGDNEHAETIGKSTEKMDLSPSHPGPTASALNPMTFADEERARFREQVKRSRSSIFKNSAANTQANP